MERIAMPDAAPLPSDALLASRKAPAEDRRRHRRIRLDLDAKFVMPDGGEAEGKVVCVSAGGAEVVVAGMPPVGRQVVLYADRVGRLEGQVLRPTRDGFVLAFSKRASRAKRLADTLTWVANMGPERDRRGSRRYGRNEAATLLRASGDAMSCRILDISTTGASVGIDAQERPAIGEEIVLGVMRARVVRYHEAGVGVAFATDTGARTDAPTQDVRTPAMTRAEG